MSTTVSGAQVLAGMDRLAEDLISHAEELRALDAAIGDGDLGITITIGCAAVREAEIAAMCRAAAQGVKERGKSDVGQKTLLDALVPAAEALETAATEGASIPEGLRRAAAAAEAGAAATETMKSQVGRASWFTDRTAGVRDPGAQAIALAFASLAKHARKED
jgi:dihydroxyacetone kinase-like protein